MDRWRALGCWLALVSTLIVAALLGALARQVVEAFRFDE